MLTACALAFLAAAAPASPSRWVVDEAQLLSGQTRQQLDRRLEAFQHQTGHQVLVYIAATTGEEPIEDWTHEAFEAWGVGRAGLDDGAVLFLFTDDRAARIEVGYGLEERLNDATASQIINEVLAPKIAVMPDAAVTDAVDAMLKVISPDSPPLADEPLERPAPSPIKLALYVVGAIALLVLFWRNPGLALFLLSVITRRGGGNGHGGGGFSGGGGRSGGGGATGRW